MIKSHKPIKRFYAVDDLDLIYEESNYYIASYKQICPITGRPTQDVFYVILNKDYTDTDDIAYDSFDLCKMVLQKRAMKQMNLIKQIVTEFNLREKERKERTHDISLQHHFEDN